MFSFRVTLIFTYVIKNRSAFITKGEKRSAFTNHIILSLYWSVDMMKFTVWTSGAISQIINKYIWAWSCWCVRTKPSELHRLWRWVMETSDWSKYRGTEHVGGTWNSPLPNLSFATLATERDRNIMCVCVRWNINKWTYGSFDDAKWKHTNHIKSKHNYSWDTNVYHYLCMSARNRISRLTCERLERCPCVFSSPSSIVPWAETISLFALKTPVK